MNSCDYLFHLLLFFPKKTYYMKLFVTEIFFPLIQLINYYDNYAKYKFNLYFSPYDETRINHLKKYIPHNYACGSCLSLGLLSSSHLLIDSVISSHYYPGRVYSRTRIFTHVHVHSLTSTHTRVRFLSSSGGAAVCSIITRNCLGKLSLTCPMPNSWETDRRR